MFVIAVALFLSAFRSHRSFFCVSRKSAVLIQEAPSVARRVPQWSVCYVLWHWGIHGSSGSELVAHLVSKVWKILDFQGALEDFKHYSPLLGDIIVEQQWISKIGFNLQSSVLDWRFPNKSPGESSIFNPGLKILQLQKHVQTLSKARVFGQIFAERHVCHLQSIVCSSRLEASSSSRCPP